MNTQSPTLNIAYKTLSYLYFSVLFVQYTVQRIQESLSPIFVSTEMEKKSKAR